MKQDVFISLHYSMDKPTHRMVYELLRDMVVCGKIIEGERIIETEYAEYFNVSRTPIRSALKRMEQNGLVVPASRGGMIAKGLGIDGINSMFDLQGSLEKLVFPRTVSHITEEEVGVLIRHLDEIEQLIQEGKIMEGAALNEKIHRLLFKMSRFEGIMDAVDVAYGYVNGFNLQAFLDVSRQYSITREHRAMIDALKSKELKSLMEVADQHLESCRRYSIEKFKENCQKRKEELVQRLLDEEDY